MEKSIRIGIAEAGISHDMLAPPDIETRFRMVSESGVIDYIDKTPARADVNRYRELSAKYDVPILAGGWWYTLGRDEPMLEEKLRIGGELGSIVHNIQIMMDHSDGHLVTNQEIVDTYLWAYDIGAAIGCLPSLEVHINMWSEDFRRVAQVAQLVQARGVPFRMTLDHSHVIFKIDNPRELAIFGLDEAVADGELILDPFAPGNICDAWINAGYVALCHARATVPNNPRNVWAHHPSLETLASSRHPRDTVGRGVQYPFIAPEPGQWHSPWDEAKLEPWKEVIRHLLRHDAHIDGDSATQRLISTEFIPFPDYGEGAKYSLFDNSVACARWIREEWESVRGSPLAVAPS